MNRADDDDDENSTTSSQNDDHHHHLGGVMVTPMATTTTTTLQVGEDRQNSSWTRQDLMQSPEPPHMRRSRQPLSIQAHSLRTTSSFAEPYLVTPDYQRQGSGTACCADNDDNDGDDNDLINDSLEMSLEEHCFFLPEVERLDCQNPVALTLLHNNSTLKEDWHYLDRVDVVNYDVRPAPFSQHPPLPNLISRPQPIRPTAIPPPPFWTNRTIRRPSC